ncbi:hypothetical protein, partial [Pseudomonas aeruginosa]|uniref:hypothetical protein n=1 Tax=Pseudomonas aeruginosa TaxID=287 RepID=UPI001A9F59FC
MTQTMTQKAHPWPFPSTKRPRLRMRPSSGHFLHENLIYPCQSRKPHTFGSLTKSHLQNSSMPPLRELPDKTTLIASPAFLIASRCTWSGHFRSA